MLLTPRIEDYHTRSLHARRVEGGLRISAKLERTSTINKPLVSIITVVFNGEETVEQTIQSVLTQTYDNIEYIIIDGESRDRTLDVIRKYENRIDYWISEPDEGISDAFNKGIAQSSGSIIGILNADDWLSKNQIELGVNALNMSSAEFSFGNLLFHDHTGALKYRINGDSGYMNVIHSKMPNLCHPTVLVKRTAYERIGLFDINIRFAMDYEWLLRLHKEGGKGIYVQNLDGHMRVQGTSDISHVKALNEVRKISVRYGQSKLKADLLFIFRTVKGTARRILEKKMPFGFYHKLRRMVNRNYSIDP